MKMICPQCGVKGSADDALLGRKVKCPKCNAIFEVAAEVVETIDVDELELEQIEPSVEPEGDAASEEEVDQVLNSLLARESDQLDTESALADEAPAETLPLPETFPGEDELVAALSDLNETDGDEEGGQNDDETLTIIEDFPADALQDTVEAEEEDSDLVLDDLDSSTVEQDEIHLEDEQQDLQPVDDSLTADEIEKSLDFEDGFFDEEVIANEERKEGHGEQEDSPDELFDQPEKEDLPADSELEAEQVVDENGSVEEKRRQEKEEVPPESVGENDVILAASFLDDNLDAKLAADEDDGAELDDEAVAIIQKCSACDRYVDPKTKYDHEGNVYCLKCIPADLPEEERLTPLVDVTPSEEESETAKNAEAYETPQHQDESTEAYVPGKFTIMTLIKDSWSYAKGVKGSLWGAILVMYVILIGLGVGYTLLAMNILSGMDEMTATLIDGGVQALISFLSFVFSAGVLMIAINRIGHKPYSWKMVFSGFERLGSLFVLIILQTLMLFIGFLLFVIPGIYLSVGYILAIPLLLVKGLSPWQALERSRKAIHTRWWTIFFALIVMTILISISAIPLGIGLIWTIPMVVVMVGVLYYLFFGAEEEEDMEDEEADDEELAVEEEMA